MTPDCSICGERFCWHMLVIRDPLKGLTPKPWINDQPWVRSGRRPKRRATGK